MESSGLRCLYHNSGAFGFADDVTTLARGWIGAADETIRPAARSIARIVPPPVEKTLANMAGRVWNDRLPGPIWLMPKSQWSYELQFGSHDWLPVLLRDLGVDPALLAPRNNAAALEFHLDERESLTHLVQTLLLNLLGSDFLMAFPGRPIVCTLHHPKQLWWMTTDQSLVDRLDAMV